MKIKEVKKRKARLKTKDISQLELKFIENPKKKIKIFLKSKQSILYLEYS